MIALLDQKEGVRKAEGKDVRSDYGQVNSVGAKVSALEPLFSYHKNRPATTTVIPSAQAIFDHYEASCVKGFEALLARPSLSILPIFVSIATTPSHCTTTGTRQPPTD